MGARGHDREGLVVGGRYRLIRKLGEGGMGVVYEAEQIEVGTRLAVKILLPMHANDADLVTRFRREAQIAGSLGSAHICSVVDLGVTEDREHYFVMEMLRGESLAAAIGQGRLPLERAARIVDQVLATLALAHRSGVVHRDLKPENVFLAELGEQRDFVKVLDFGISKIVSSDLPPLTRTGEVFGTPHYMAPEQTRGQRDQDHRVDLWATGVILYEALTGRRPFEGTTFAEVLVKILAEPFARPRELVPSIPEAVEAVVLRALERDRDRRHPDAESMRVELRGAVAAAPPPEAGLAGPRSLPVASTPPPRAQDSVHPPPTDAPLFTRGVPAAQEVPRSGAAVAAAPSAPPVRRATGRGMRVAVALAAALLVAGGVAALGLGGAGGGPAPQPADRQDLTVPAVRDAGTGTSAPARTVGPEAPSRGSVVVEAPERSRAAAAGDAGAARVDAPGRSGAPRHVASQGTATTAGETPGAPASTRVASDRAVTAVTPHEPEPPASDAPSAVMVRLGGFEFVGSPDANTFAIARALRARAGRLRGCWADGSSGATPQAGRMDIELVVETNGSVGAVRVDPGSVGDAGVAACVSRSLQAVAVAEPPPAPVRVRAHATFAPPP